ncbi:MAG: topoisomerase C-terminal repeat-containing protein, partial [Thermoplasmatota archaeon]
KELGQHPRKKKPMTLHTGRYGPYIKCDKTNATVPKDKDPLALTTEEAIALVDEKEAKNQ